MRGAGSDWNTRTILHRQWMSQECGIPPPRQPRLGRQKREQPPIKILPSQASSFSNAFFTKARSTSTKALQWLGKSSSSHCGGACSRSRRERTLTEGTGASQFSWSWGGEGSWADGSVLMGSAAFCATFIIIESVQRGSQSRFQFNSFERQ